LNSAALLEELSDCMLQVVAEMDAGERARRAKGAENANAEATCSSKKMMEHE